MLGIPVEKTLPKSGIVLRLMPAGMFTMDGNEILTNPFYLGKYKVTQGQWKRVMGNNPSHFQEAGDDAPVEHVSWNDCQNFMEKIAALEEMPG